jgi:phage terminase large subunit-like protein
MEFHPRRPPLPRPLPVLLGIVFLLGIAVAGRGEEASTKAVAAGGPAQIRYEGTLWVEAHFKRPHEIRPYHSEAIYSADGRGRSRLDWTVWADGDSSRVPESYLAVGDSVFHRDAPGASWQLLAGMKRRQERLQAVAGIQSELGRLAQSQARVGGSDFMFDGPRFVYTERHAHPRLGDVIDSVALTYEGTEKLPQEVLVVVHEPHHQWRLVQHPVGAPSSAFPESLLVSPTVFKPPAANVDSLIGEPRIVPIAPGLWAAEMDDVESRSMIVEFTNHLALIEIAASSANGERLADAARRRWPNKPIRYALFSHHHPHYLGGIRAMIAEGATVVTTPGNESFVREVSTLLFESKPDRLARTARRVKIRTFQDRIELADSTNQLIAINYGERSQHTDEFAVFWFPRAKLLFEAELGWVRVDGKLRASRRAAALLPWLKEQKLDVERFVQSWPMREEEASLTRTDLEALVQAAKR